jgi:hypothetical protein
MADLPALSGLSEKGFWAFLFEVGGSPLVPTGGFVSHQQLGQLDFVRIDVPRDGGGLQPRLFPPTAIAAIIPSTKEKVMAQEVPNS